MSSSRVPVPTSLVVPCSTCAAVFHVFHVAEWLASVTFAARQLFTKECGPQYADAVATAITDWRGLYRSRRAIRSTIELRHIIDSAVSAAKGVGP